MQSSELSGEVTPQHVSIGGDFARVFDHEDYIAMVNSFDEASVVLRGHLVLEEFLNIWSSRITRTDDLFSGVFVSFKTKLVISRNLGLSAQYSDIFDKFNEVRNRYSHRRKYALELTTLDVLRKKVDALDSDPVLTPCEEFEIFIEGVDSNNQRRQISHTWATADTKKRLVVLLVVLVLKLVKWMQLEFNARDIPYNLVVWPARSTAIDNNCI